MYFSTVILYFLLGCITSLMSTIFLSFVIRTRLLSYILGAFLIILSFILLLLTIFKYKTCYDHFVFIIASVFCLIGGSLCEVINSQYHIKSHYFNRASVYFFIEGSVSITLSLLWPIFTKIFMKKIIPASAINREQERLLYTMINLLNALLLALVIPSTDSVTTSSLSIYAILYSFGIWLVGGTFAATCGISIERKAKKIKREATRVTATSKAGVVDDIN
ncbi:hypothetical protein TRFO_17638 [Tritrichomonas foetus]|uniref:Uncharacterized protein n=1 Tax=Tritrichomonas foetus TaxID=1144522 RepID=A0A1J4KSN6_9EUKA|nr:hypothetical protein TRFO_17638 [Tritrichomonas foetus]|eukprot:OHT12485.1 hypothetical protein TRFO_17638 [Tritrichomonas foetus]